MCIVTSNNFLVVFGDREIFIYFLINKTNKSLAKRLLDIIWFEDNEFFERKNINNSKFSTDDAVLSASNIDISIFENLQKIISKNQNWY